MLFIKIGFKFEWEMPQVDQKVENQLQNHKVITTTIELSQVHCIITVSDLYPEQKSIEDLLYRNETPETSDIPRIQQQEESKSTHEQALLVI